MQPVNRYLSRLADNFAARGGQTFCRTISAAGVEHITWRDLEHACAGYAREYCHRQLVPGAQVLIFLRDLKHMYASFFGAMAAGFVPAFMPCASLKQDPQIYWRSHQLLLEKIRPAAIVAEEDTFTEMREAGLALCGAAALRPVQASAEPLRFAPRSEDDVALLQHSSGTTGLKKGVALSFAAISDHAERYAAAIGLSGSDTVVSWLPLYHDMGLMACCVVPAFTATPLVQIDTMYWLGRPHLLLDELQRADSALCWLPNFAFEHLAATAGRLSVRYDLSRVRAFINCSEPCKPATFDRFLAAFAKSGVRAAQLQCCYAMAETVFAATQTQLNTVPHRIRVASASLAQGAHVTPQEGGDVELIETGRPVDGISATIYDTERRPLPPGVVGEIGLAGRYLFSGYNRDPERTDAALAGGTYFSRDLGFLLDGRLFVLGRIDDLVIVNGRNLYAHEIEAVVSGIAGVKAGRAVAIAEFDARAGSDSLVVIAEKNAARAREPAEIQSDILNAIFSTFAVMPRTLRLVSEGWLVKTTSGKISRKENLLKHQAEPAGDKKK